MSTAKNLATKLYYVRVDALDGGPSFLVCAETPGEARAAARYCARDSGWTPGRVVAEDATSSADAWDRLRSHSTRRVRLGSTGRVVEVQS